MDKREPGRKRRIELDDQTRTFGRPAKVNKGLEPGRRTVLPPKPSKSHDKPAYLSKVPILRPADDDKGSFYSSTSFKRAGASDEVAAALRAMGVTRPSWIQAQSYPILSHPLSAGGPAHVVLADAAGSGKTLAYLLPLLQQLREREAVNGGPVTRPHQPSIVVICPTTELAQQVYRVVRALSRAGLKARSAACTPTLSGSYRTQKEALREGVDVVVATPLRLAALLEHGDLSLAGCRGLVLDEVDILLGDAGDSSAFSEQVAPLLQQGGPDMRLVMVTATLPDHKYDQLREMFPKLAAAFGPGLHKVAPGLVEELVDCSGGEEVSLESGTQRKLAALLSVLQQHRARRALVFCNKIDSCRRVENFLQRQDRKGEQFQVIAYHAAISKSAQQEALDRFLAEDTEGSAPLYLVCTDRTSRGLDSILCEHVVLFDFPRDPSEYVRRVGRTARGAGGKGTVSVLVLGKQVQLAKSILDRNRKGGTVHRIPLTYMPYRAPPPGTARTAQPSQTLAKPPAAPVLSAQQLEEAMALTTSRLPGALSADSTVGAGTAAGGDRAGGVIAAGAAHAGGGNGAVFGAAGTAAAAAAAAAGGAAVAAGAAGAAAAGSSGHGSTEAAKRDDSKGDVSAPAAQAAQGTGDAAGSVPQASGLGRSGDSSSGRQGRQGDVDLDDLDGVDEFEGELQEGEFDEGELEEGEFDEFDEDDDELVGDEDGIEPGDDFVVVKGPGKLVGIEDGIEPGDDFVVVKKPSKPAGSQ